MKKVFVFLTLTFLGFIVPNYFLGVLLIEEYDNEIQFNFQSKEIDSLTITFNNLPTQFGAQNHRKLIGKDNGDYVTIKINPYEQIKNIYILPDTPGEIKFSSIRLISFFKDIEFNVIDHLNSIEVQNSWLSNIEEPNNRFAKGSANLSKNEMIIVKSEILNQVYRELYSPILLISIVFSLLILFLCILCTSKFNGISNLPLSQILLISFFLLIIFGFFFMRKESSNLENRVLAEKPTIHQNLWKIPRKYSNYYKDHFPFRVQLSKAINYFKIKFFNSSPNPNFVEIGKEGWLFYSTDKIKKVYQGIDLFSVGELDEIKHKLELKQKFLLKKGISFYLMIPPLKHSVYPEYLPTSLQVQQVYSKRDQVIEYLKNNSNIKLIDPFERLVELKEEGLIYYKTDTHWNQKGGFAAYKLLVDRIRKDYTTIRPTYSLKDYTIDKREDFDGDLINLLNFKGIFSREALFMEPDFEVPYELMNDKNIMGTEILVERYKVKSEPELPKLLMYRDSYSSYMNLHISNHFSESVFVWDRNLNIERINQEKPDIIVLEMMERFVNHLKEDEFLIQ